jgi:hypothetical protein
MAKKELVTTVHVADDDGVYHAFGPGDDVPAWAVKAISNPKVWAGGDESEAAPEAKPTGSAGAVKRPASK